MNETLQHTCDVMRAIAKASDIKTKRGFTDFLADRIVQATTQPTLLSMTERFAALMQSQIEYIGGSKTAALLSVINELDADAVLGWLREYPRVAAMILTLRSDREYESSIEYIQIVVSARDKGTALPAPAYDIPITMTCLSALSHGGDTKAGNATLFRRMQVLSTTEQILTLPFYAGNALRGQMRDMLADHFLVSLGLTPNRTQPPCSLWFFHALYAGGALEENSEQAKLLGKRLGANGAVRAEGIHEFRNMIPFLSLLGTALGNRIPSGRINTCDYRPECKEWGNGNLDAASLFEWTFLTRREDHEDHIAGENSSMIAMSECLSLGTVLHGGIDVSDHATPLERSCLGKGLALLQDHGYIGAENRRGFGQVQIAIENMPDPSLYDNYLAEHRQEILTYLESIGAVNASGQSDSAGDSDA